MESIKDPILQIKDVSISYGSNKRAVKNVTADVAKNTITAIMGIPVCSGKRDEDLYLPVGILRLPLLLL